ncbi:hypothetical protein MAP00_002687 [Monascus purpureus]|nr:hypothetical protein MAP00_002687 [Monascus purpureus]
MVFDRVIQEVCDASQVDFEESGVDQQTLIDLRKSWQKKLSSLGVAHFPWDPPPPQPTPPPNQTPVLHSSATVPSNAPRPIPHSQAEQHVPSQALPHSLPVTVPSLQAPISAGTAGPTSQGPRIKTEPDTNDHSGLPVVNGMIPAHSSSSQSARERAATMLHQRYGAAAANSVSQLQAQSHMTLGLPGHQQQRPQGSHVPNGQGPITHQHHQPPMNKTQTDGAGDDPLSEWKAEVMRRRQAAERQNSEGDQLIREQIRLQMLRLEGGGLLRPLDEHQSPRLASRHVGPSYPNQTAITATSLDQLPGCEPTVGKLRAQFDGADDNDVKAEDDEDAINSDLDDPDDPINEEHEGDDAVGQVMLCTYDKVQRVKNKWKCTLKDGILTTGGREYVFHKAQGEFEW